MREVDRRVGRLVDPGAGKSERGLGIGLSVVGVRRVGWEMHVQSGPPCPTLTISTPALLRARASFAADRSPVCAAVRGAVVAEREAGLSAYPVCGAFTSGPGDAVSGRCFRVIPFCLRQSISSEMSPPLSTPNCEGQASVPGLDQEHGVEADVLAPFHPGGVEAQSPGGGRDRGSEVRLVHVAPDEHRHRFSLSPELLSVGVRETLQSRAGCRRVVRVVVEGSRPEPVKQSAAPVRSPKCRRCPAR